MVYVITEPCIGEKDQACVAVCPVDCIHPHEAEPGFTEAPQLYINPEECISCGACEAVCPVAAIFSEEAVPQEWQHYIGLNARHFIK